jgi:DNA polymerase III alpha subunit
VNDLRTLTCDRQIQQMLRSGQTMGCFYIESPAMRQLLQQLKTASFRDLTAASSVIRPGVAQSGMMQEYIRRVNGGPPRLPSHPLVDELLEETKGVMVFQEDVMRVAHRLAGFTPAEADLLRRAMNGKLRGTDQMHRLEKRWQQGCEAKGVDRASADEIWRQLSSFSDFSFCKAHSASFATLSYQMAWLKAHYPADFMAAVITNGGGFYGPQAYLSECRRLGLAILPPDVNHSEYEYSASSGGCRTAGQQPFGSTVAAAPPDAIRVGLCTIRNVAAALLERIPAERARRGPFRNLPDFIRRVRPQRAELEVLVLSGACDSLGPARPELLWEAGLAPVQRTEYKVQGAGTQAELLCTDATVATLHPPCALHAAPGLTPYSPAKLLQLEVEHLGLFISRHPLEAFPGLPEQGIVRASDLARHIGRRVSLLGWCIATKRVNIAERRPSVDLLSLQAAEFDLPDNPEAAEDDDAPASAAVDIGLIARGPDPRSGGHDYYAPATHSMKFMSMEDTTGTYEATLFPQAYARFAPLTRCPGPFIVTGRVEEQYGVCSVNCDRLELAGTERPG